MLVPFARGKMESYEKNSIIPDRASGDDLLVLYVLITIALLALFVIVTTIMGGSLLFLVTFGISSVVYFAYAYYLISVKKTRRLDHLINVMLIWSIIYIVLQAVIVVTTVTI